MNNQAYQSIVDELFTLLAPRGFTRDQVARQIAQLMEICLLRLESELMQEASIIPQSLTLDSWEKFLKECAAYKPELYNRLSQEFNSLLEEYLKEVKDDKTDSSGAI